jgi:transposase
MGSRKYKKYSVEFREQAVRLVLDSSRPIADVARQLSVNEGTLSNWVRQYRREHPVSEEPLTVSERARLQELEKENRELRMKSEFLGKAAAFFAQEYR